MQRFIQLSISVIVLLLCASPLWANYSPFPERHSMATLPSIILLDLASDAFFILLSLVILKQKGKIGLGTIMKVCLFAMAAGFAADGIGLCAMAWADNNQVDPALYTIGGLMICAILIFVANYNLGRYYFQLNSSQSVVMGLIVGIFTIPVAGILAVKIWTRNAIFGYQYEIREILIYTIIGILFAMADIVLLRILKPISSISGSKITMAVFLSATVIAICGIYLISRLMKEEENKVSTCMSRMEALSSSIERYRQRYDSYPPDLKTLSGELSLDDKSLHCPLNEGGSSAMSYEYKAPRSNNELSGWLLRCRHDQKSDIYISMLGFPQVVSHSEKRE